SHAEPVGCASDRLRARRASLPLARSRAALPERLGSRRRALAVRRRASRAVDAGEGDDALVVDPGRDALRPLPVAIGGVRDGALWRAPDGSAPRAAPRRARRSEGAL